MLVRWRKVRDVPDVVDATTSVKMEDFVGFRYMTYRFESCPDYMQKRAIGVFCQTIAIKKNR